MPVLYVNGIPLAYALHPALPGAGPTPLVIAHGLGTATPAAEWAYFVRAARALGPVLTYDLRGHGGSGAGAHPADTTLADLTADLTGLLDALGIARARLLGHSLGGMIVLDFTLRHPERVDALILESTTPEAPPPEERERLLRADLPPGPLLLGRGSHRDGACVMRPLPRGEGGWAGRPAVHALITRPEQTPFLQEIRAPTLVLVGELEGVALQRGAELLHGWIPTSRLVRIAGAGHRAHVEQPDGFERQVSNFVTEVAQMPAGSAIMEGRADTEGDE